MTIASADRELITGSGGGAPMQRVQGLSSGGATSENSPGPGNFRQGPENVC